MEAIKSEIANGNATLLDVRTEAEWTQEHALGAVHIPLDRVASDYKTLINSELPIYIYCGSGKRASEAKLILDSLGLKSFNIGGLTDWKQAGGKTVTNQ